MLTTLLLAAAAFAAGVTGAWSPCGFSMVETLAGAAGREGASGRRLIRAACATFAAGALLGGALTFGLLSVLGQALGAGGEAGVIGGGAGDGADLALIAAAALALAAALADGLGLRVAPQIRRQVPERWRRTLPLPLAAALYGVLLGLGFTTFVLAFAVWALAGICVALGAPATGLAIGVAFGLGRALPVVAMAPRFDTLGIHLAERMAAEPRLLRTLRRADAALLVAAALALLLGPTAASADARANLVATDATDPSVSDGALAWMVPGDGRAVIRVPGQRPASYYATRLAIGEGNLATATPGAIEVRTLADGAQVATIPHARAGITGLAVSQRWVAMRMSRPRGGDELLVASLAGAAVAPVVQTRSGGSLSRPSLDGDQLAYAVGTRHGSRIVVRDLATGQARTVLRSRRTQLSQPSVLGHALLYVEARACDQRLRITTTSGRRRTRTLLTLGGTARRDRGHEHGHARQGNRPSGCPRGTPPRSGRMLWSTALAADAAYVTRWTPRTRRTALLRLPR
ncbi:LpqB family beta-propeller domain-containing protein [Conexibacter stalactiti]|uniref:Cytochrome C biogenesis protein transmembrane domain-containing protein n=1 Tax=Conexibacter stalactiti TaxID=1940611 RepID=A0ABU4HW72_9ACTN|nr:LpqB family beta-propeller domain-containing protein [Conexibacter stalactiti]MDW5597572.1 hypothetical protein [Conexibacter stalactiti]MEC5038214.1 LpqB family beta-propeller domain-containing protein [Conexibacter stalactiti]